MKQIHKAVQALESHIGFWRSSWILLKKLKNDEKNLQSKFARANMHTAILRNNPSRGVWLFYQILKMAKMSNTEISAKILKHVKKAKLLLSESHQKLFSSRPE